MVIMNINRHCSWKIYNFFMKNYILNLRMWYVEHLSITITFIIHVPHCNQFSKYFTEIDVDNTIVFKLNVDTKWILEAHATLWVTPAACNHLACVLRLPVPAKEHTVHPTTLTFNHQYLAPTNTLRSRWLFVRSQSQPDRVRARARVHPKNQTAWTV